MNPEQARQALVESSKSNLEARLKAAQEEAEAKAAYEAHLERVALAKARKASEVAQSTYATQKGS